MSIEDNYQLVATPVGDQMNTTVPKETTSLNIAFEASQQPLVLKLRLPRNRRVILEFEQEAPDIPFGV